jgi:hypothetical protein
MANHDRLDLALAEGVQEVNVFLPCVNQALKPFNFVSNLSSDSKSGMAIYDQFSQLVCET